MTIEVRRSEATDRRAILDLMDSARGIGLSPTEQAERGFVQGVMDEATLIRLEPGPGVFIAEEDGTFAGFAMTAEPHVASDGPPRLALEAARAAVGNQRLFMYGPAAVEPRFQGRGVLTVLLSTLSAQLCDRFDFGVAFVEHANRKSLAVHRHYAMTEVPGFSVEARQYHVFTFAPAQFATLGH